MDNVDLLYEAYLSSLAYDKAEAASVVLKAMFKRRNCGVVTDEQVSEVLAEVVFYWEEYLSLKGKDE